MGIKDTNVYNEAKRLYNEFKVKLKGEKNLVTQEYYKHIGKKLNLENPATLNEKIIWLKLNYSEKFYVKCCDKYLVHEYLKEKLGTDYAPSMLYYTRNPNDINLEKIREFPCIIKVSNGSGANLIIHKKDEYTNEYLQSYFKKQIALTNIHNVYTREHQYLKRKPYIVVEKLLSDEKGGIPNDYKFLYTNGNLQFIYCSVDRLGINVRQVYDKGWNRLHFIWVENANKELFEHYEKSESMEKPKFFYEMLSLSHKIAEDFPLVRVDFYETKDNLYIGEITLHHGSGYDKFYPEKYDMIYGSKLSLPKANR